jgi:hypothetical protein
MWLSVCYVFIFYPFYMEVSYEKTYLVFDGDSLL